ncbi:MAG: hypothetical protein H0V76_07070 [Blastocatellia bacterium]|nr:hypothetical protein [Blastocatellia bacterium]
MQEEKDEDREIATEREDHDVSDEDVDEVEHPAPGIEHHNEPDAENIMPAKDRPGTL